MMKTLLIRLILPFSLIIHSIVQITPGLYFLAPTDGQVVAGTVEVKGSVPDIDFSYAELAYAFSNGSSSNWFQIKRIDQPVHDDLLAMWDTTTITDGVYRLKLTVHQKSGETHEVILENIKVGNYTHYDSSATATPASVIQSSTETISTPTDEQSPQPTQLPKNPASIDQNDIRLSLGSGLVLAVLILGVLGVYTYFRQKARK
jgi:hypothetical protein